jgi:hypothetical protein
MAVSPVLFMTPPPAPEGEAFPGFLTCSYTTQPPERGVYLNVTGTDGHMSVQVLEYTALYWSISTTGVLLPVLKLLSLHHWRWPDVGFIARCRALEAVVDIQLHIQEHISRERKLLKLPPDKPLPQSLQRTSRIFTEIILK